MKICVKYFVICLTLLIFCKVGLLYAQTITPQQQIDALNNRITKDVAQWAIDNSDKQLDFQDIHQKDADINAQNQEIQISQDSINDLEESLNQDNSDNNDENLDTQGTIR